MQLQVRAWVKNTTFHLLIQLVFFSVWWDQFIIGNLMSCYEYELRVIGFAKHEGNYIYHLSRFFSSFSWNLI